MKKTLLATVAVAALIAGPALAQRQEAPAGDVKGAAPPPAAIQKAPAEKIAPAGKVAPDRAADTKAPKSETTGQASPSGRSSETDVKSRSGADTKAERQARHERRHQAGAERASPAGRGHRHHQVRHSARRQGVGQHGFAHHRAEDKIRTTVLTANAPRVTNVNFSINVGTVVPRTVRVVAVPATLVEIHPAWRGYMYFVHGDEIMIVEPGTLRIVTVIDV